MQAALAPGQRLVTRAGDLFRWDGMRVMAGEAASSAALHLQKVNQLAEMTGQAEAAQARAEDAAAAGSSKAREQGAGVDKATTGKDSGPK